jgi:hypothetical protein
MRQTAIDILLAAIMISAAALMIHAADRGTTPPMVVPVKSSGDHFATVDVYVDPHGATMAAYQIEISPRVMTGGETTFVSLSGGKSHPAFRHPPYYDKDAEKIPESRLIIAAFSTDADLPKTKTRVAQIDVMYTGSTPPTFAAVPVVVSTPEAEKIESATVDVQVIPAVVR